MNTRDSETSARRPPHRATATSAPTTPSTARASEARATPPGDGWRRWADQLPERPWARGVAARLEPVARRALPPGPARDTWRGRWLGHALHPMLTDVPIGFWTNASVLDLFGGRAAAPAARKLVGLGMLTAVPTALAGMADLAEADERSRVIGSVHAAANLVGLACYAASYQARRRSRRVRGALWAGAGAGVATVGGYLGGHLAQVRGLGDLHDRARRAPVPATPCNS